MKNNLNKVFKVVTIIITIIIVIFIVYGVKEGIVNDKNKLINYISSLGIYAPIFFVFLQAAQVVFPVIPGGASCLAGVLAFGPIYGFVYNYIGLVLGSIIVFSLSRTYGLKLLRKIFKEETINKYLKYINHGIFTKVFFFGILIPGAPDDLLCYISGISQMKFKTFFLIILVGKPLTLILYSLFVYFL